MMPTAQFLEIVRGKGKDKPNVRLGTVASVDTVTGRPSIIFDGETEPSLKRYPKSKGYTPVEGDRVYLIVVGNSYIVVDAID